MRDATIKTNEAGRSYAGKPVASSAGTRILQCQERRATLGGPMVANTMEVIMTVHTSQPSKEMVREYLERRNHEVDPPPTPEEIRRQLGWGLVMFDEKQDGRT
jgi:hypothetical protein